MGGKPKFGKMSQKVKMKKVVNQDPAGTHSQHTPYCALMPASLHIRHKKQTSRLEQNFA